MLKDALYFRVRTSLSYLCRCKSSPSYSSGGVGLRPVSKDPSLEIESHLGCVRQHNRLDRGRPLSPRLEHVSTELKLTLTVTSTLSYHRSRVTPSIFRTPSFYIPPRVEVTVRSLSLFTALLLPPSVSLSVYWFSFPHNPLPDPRLGRIPSDYT